MWITFSAGIEVKLPNGRKHYKNYREAEDALRKAIEKALGKSAARKVMIDIDNIPCDMVKD